MIYVCKNSLFDGNALEGKCHVHSCVSVRTGVAETLAF